MEGHLHVLDAEGWGWTRSARQLYASGRLQSSAWIAYISEHISWISQLRSVLSRIWSCY